MKPFNPNFRDRKGTYCFYKGAVHQCIAHDEDTNAKTIVKCESGASPITIEAGSTEYVRWYRSTKQMQSHERIRTHIGMSAIDNFIVFCDKEIPEGNSMYSVLTQIRYKMHKTRWDIAFFKTAKQMLGSEYNVLIGKATQQYFEDRGYTVSLVENENQKRLIIWKRRNW